jgi:radical SAM protein with 4Fe4S-binding SPASM domain
MTGPRNGSLTVVFKGSNRCTARCVFCSVGEPGARIICWPDFELVATELERLAEQYNLARLRFTFHGGEPTLLGAEFIDRACQRIRQLPVETSFSMQSNLLWDEEELVQVIERHQIQLGTSMDPICGERRTPAGEDAFPAWLERFLILAERGLTPGAIFVVTRAALGQARRLYQIAESLSAAIGRPFGLQVNPVYAQGRAAIDRERLISPREFGDFLVDLFDRWNAGARRIALTPIQQLADSFPRPLGGRNLSCTFQRDCSRSHVGIDFDLNVAGCGRRLDSGAFFGNLRERSLLELMQQSDEQRAIAGRAARLSAGECQGCDYFALCYGGCPDDAWLSTGSVERRFEWCESYRALFEAIEQRLTVPSDARPVPRAPRALPLVRVHPVLEAGATLQLDETDEPTEVWLLPDEAERALSFDSPLGFPRGPRRVALRLWVPNRRRRSLLMWEDLLRQRGCSVVLFETTDLEETLNVLNALGAWIQLDLLRLLEEPEAERVLDRVLERFITDPLWKAQLLPFSSILQRAMHGRPSSYVTRWGMHPGRFRLVPAHTEPPEGGEGARILAELRDAQYASLAAWLGARRPCLECELRDVCGGCLARGDTRPCHPWALRMVRRMVEVAAEVRDTWESQSSD